MKKPVWRDDLDVADNLRKRLPKIARKYFARGRNALDPGAGWKKKHAFRLATKQFRYTLELFRAEYGPGLEERIEHLKKVQDLLGKANDYIVTAEILKSTAGTDELRARFSRKAESRVKQLRSWWRTNMEPEAVEKRWIVYLERFAGRHGARRTRPAPGVSPSRP